MMRKRYLYLASALFLLAAAVCGWLVSAAPVSGVRIPVCCADNRMGYIDDSGRMVIAPRWDTATPFGPDNHALVSINRKSPGTWVQIFKRWFQRRNAASYGMAEYFRIDRFGNLTPARNPAIHGRDEKEEQLDSFGMKLEQREEFRWVLADGAAAFPGSWPGAIDFAGEDPAAVFADGRWGFINRKGDTVIPFRWDKTLGFDGNGRACVAVGWKWGMIDRQGDLVVPLRFKSLAGSGSAGLFAAELASGWGFIHPDGSPVIPFRYQKVDGFDPFGMARVLLNDEHGVLRCGWIDLHGQSVVRAIHDMESPSWSSNFSDHELLPVVTSGKAGLIDRKGRTVVAAAGGELMPIEDPAAPGRGWITALPHRSKHSPDGTPRPPFQPACYDTTGNLIWSGSQRTRASMFTAAALFCGALSGLLLVIAGRLPRNSA